MQLLLKREATSPSTKNPSTKELPSGRSGGRRQVEKLLACFISWTWRACSMMRTPKSRTSMSPSSRYCLVVRSRERLCRSSGLFKWCLTHHGAAHIPHGGVLWSCSLTWYTVRREMAMVSCTSSSGGTLQGYSQSRVGTELSTKLLAHGPRG